MNAIEQIKRGIKPIILVLIIGFLLGGLLGYHWGKSASEKSIVQDSIQGNNPTNESSASALYPRITSEKKGLQLNKVMHYRDPIQIRFDDWQNTTYDETKFWYKDKSFYIYKINLKNADVQASMHKSDLGGEHLEYVYEGVQVSDQNLLIQELEQNSGLYAQSLYHPEYEIIVNKGGVKMKRSYEFDGPTCCSSGLKVEFLHGDNYYKFLVPYVADYERVKNGRRIIKDPLKVKMFNEFVDTILY